MLEFDPLPKIPPGARIMTRPSWSDPGFMVAANEWQFSEFSYTPPDSLIIAGNNPRRWAIGFVQPGLNPFTVRLGWQPDAFAWGQEFAALDPPLWFTTFQYGPLVQSEFYIWATNQVIIGVYELTISEV
jgi:hypothetical protein